MPAYLTPGVYYERVDSDAPAITALRTDIAGFVGIAERGPLHQAVPVRSWRQYQGAFGNFIPGGYLAYAVKGFFENGGRKCYVVRVADRDVAEPASITLNDFAGNPAWLIQASSPGVWGNLLSIRLQTTHRAQTRTIGETGAMDRDSSRVNSMANFEIGTLVRLSQDRVANAFLRVVTGVNGEKNRLEWDATLPAEFSLDRPILVESIEYTLTVFYQGVLKAIYENLSLEPKHARYAPDVIGFSPEQRNDSRDDIFPAQPPLVQISAAIVSNQPFGAPTLPGQLATDLVAPAYLTHGTDGLESLSVSDFIGEPVDPLADDLTQQANRRGLRALEIVNEIAIIAVPDILIQPEPPIRISPLPPCDYDICVGAKPPAPPQVPLVIPELPPIFSDDEIYQVQSVMVSQCEAMANRFALIDSPYNTVQEDSQGSGAAMSWRSRFESKYAGLYYPWLRVIDPLQAGTQLIRDVPASGHVAGLFARTDWDIGVHKAPANAELQWVQDTTAFINARMQEGLNPRGINVIRSFPGRGIRVYGARTVSSDSDWRFVNVRRLMMMIEQALKLATQWVVFEPNNVYTRSCVSLAAKAFLESLWLRGALAGARPEEAFFVNCSEANNPPDERELGHLNVDIGVAPSQPAEFVILRLGLITGELDSTEP